MKKLFLILFIFFIIGCNHQPKNLEEKKPIYETSYIETIPENAKPFLENTNEEIILTEQEIQEYNQRISTKTKTIYALNKINKLEKEEIKNYITSYQLPNTPKYNDGKEITNATLKTILENRNLDQIEAKDPIQKGILINRSNLRSFPTDIHFFPSKEETNFDKLQETELHINTKVLILHESLDKEWYFVLTNTYSGWIKKENVAKANEEDINYFINNKSFLIITEPLLEIENKKIDMSVKLPFIKANEKGYEVIIPEKGENDFVTKTTITIERDKGHIGYLPYTKRNLIIQAFKYENVKYSWGGMNIGVDCSSYISNIYRTFGFQFPRNTVDQKESIGKIISLANKTIEEKQTLLKENPFSLLYQPGHVMLYLGKLDNKDYIIHASGNKNELKVIKTELTNTSSYLKKIDRIVTIQ